MEMAARIQTNSTKISKSEQCVLNEIKIQRESISPPDGQINLMLDEEGLHTDADLLTNFLVSRPVAGNVPIFLRKKKNKNKNKLEQVLLSQKKIIPLQPQR
jgi:hypothetical protein